MLYDPARHEPLDAAAWNAPAAHRAIERIVDDAERRFSPSSHWPLHPLDSDGAEGSGEPQFDLYGGAAGVVWALHYLGAVGAAPLRRSYADYAASLPSLARRGAAGDGDGHGGAGGDASYLAGDTGLTLLCHWLQPSMHTAARLETLIAGNLDHPARELMYGSPGTMLAALFLHRRTGETRWADLFVDTARTLWSQQLHSPEFGCRYWTQDFAGYRFSHLGGVHGFASNAAPLIAGRALLGDAERDAWERCIVDTLKRTARWDGDCANWPPELYPTGGARAEKALLQFCHGAPGVVACVAGLPSSALDAELLAAGRTVWAAGPLAKGSNLCHGTGGNGYAFLKLYERTRDATWLDRARAFAMHGIAQTEAHARRYGQMRYSLWTGDLGFAVYLWDCIRGAAAFPTLDAFFPPAA